MTSQAGRLVARGLTRLVAGDSSRVSVCRKIHTVSPLLFRVSAVVSAEPMKRKKRIDPAVIRMREIRRQKKVEKQIKKLEKVGLKLKPIEELEVPPKLLQEKKIRFRKVEAIDQDSRASIFKEWAVYKCQQHSAEKDMIQRLMKFQALSLNELRVESEELYQECLQADATLLPFVAVGPVNTPPVESYVTVDGEYLDVTKKWE